MFLEQHIRMISEGSCDSEEEWSNDAEILIFHHSNTNVYKCLHY